ncbi:hypothetical protein [uncultured Endozoicomonas sp.]|uniref:hypothetical protein n=1 Tax=uncultured Endozoicomonas sp. TaxID=432652 RepID=UPI00260FEF41|nr:hypothetical protein [uncultured Endozoicomonas sp.]
MSSTPEDKSITDRGSQVATPKKNLVNDDVEKAKESSLTRERRSAETKHQKMTTTAIPETEGSASTVSQTTTPDNTDVDELQTLHLKLQNELNINMESARDWHFLSILLTYSSLCPEDSTKLDPIIEKANTNISRQTMALFYSQLVEYRDIIKSFDTKTGNAYSNIIDDVETKATAILNEADSEESSKGKALFDLIDEAINRLKPLKYSGKFGLFFKGLRARQLETARLQQPLSNITPVNENERVIAASLEQGLDRATLYENLYEKLHQLISADESEQAGRLFFFANAMIRGKEGTAYNHQSQSLFIDKLLDFEPPSLPLKAEHPSNEVRSDFEYGIKVALILASLKSYGGIWNEDDEFGAAFSFLQMLSGDNPQYLNNLLEQMTLSDADSGLVVKELTLAFQASYEYYLYTTVYPDGEKQRASATILQKLGVDISSKYFSQLQAAIGRFIGPMSDWEDSRSTPAEIISFLINKFDEEHGKDENFNNLQIVIHTNRNGTQSPKYRTEFIRIGLIRDNNGLFSLTIDDSTEGSIHYSGMARERLVGTTFNELFSYKIKHLLSLHFEAAVGNDVSIPIQIVPASIYSVDQLTVLQGSPLSLRDIISTPVSQLPQLERTRMMELTHQFFNTMKDRAIFTTLITPATQHKTSPIDTATPFSNLTAGMQELLAIKKGAVDGEELIKPGTEQLFKNVIKGFTGILRLSNGGLQSSGGLSADAKQAFSEFSSMVSDVLDDTELSIPSDIREALSEFNTQSQVYLRQHTEATTAAGNHQEPESQTKETSVIHSPGSKVLLNPGQLLRWIVGKLKGSEADAQTMTEQELVAFFKEHEGVLGVFTPEEWTGQTEAPSLNTDQAISGLFKSSLNEIMEWHQGSHLEVHPEKNSYRSLTGNQPSFNLLSQWQKCFDASSESRSEPVSQTFLPPNNHTKSESEDVTPSELNFSGYIKNSTTPIPTKVPETMSVAAPTKPATTTLVTTTQSTQFILQNVLINAVKDTWVYKLQLRLLKYRDEAPDGESVQPVINALEKLIKTDKLKELKSWISAFVKAAKSSDPETASRFANILDSIDRNENDGSEDQHSRRKRSPLNPFDLDHQVFSLLNQLASDEKAEAFTRFSQGIQSSITNYSLKLNNQMLDSTPTRSESLAEESKSRVITPSEMEEVKQQITDYFAEGDYYSAGQTSFDLGEISVNQHVLARSSGNSESITEANDANTSLSQSGQIEINGNLDASLFEASCFMAIVTNPLFVRDVLAGCTGYCKGFSFIQAIAGMKGISLNYRLLDMLAENQLDAGTLPQAIAVLQMLLNISHSSHLPDLNPAEAAFEAGRLKYFGFKKESLVFKNLLNKIDAINIEYHGLETQDTTLDTALDALVDFYEAQKGAAQTSEIKGAEVGIVCTFYIKVPHMIRLALEENPEGGFYIIYENSQSSLIKIPVSSLSELKTDKVRQQFGEIIRSDLRNRYSYTDEQLRLVKLTPSILSEIASLQILPTSFLTLGELVATPPSERALLDQGRKLQKLTELLTKLSQPSTRDAIRQGAFEGLVEDSTVNPNKVSSLSSFNQKVREVLEAIDLFERQGTAISSERIELIQDILATVTNELKLINSIPATVLGRWLTQEKLNNLRQLSQAMEALKEATAGSDFGVATDLNDAVTKLNTEVDAFSQKTQSISISELQLPDAESHPLPEKTVTKLKKTLKEKAYKIALEETPSTSSATKEPSSESIEKAEEQVATQFKDGADFFMAVVGAPSRNVGTPTESNSQKLSNALNEAADQGLKETAGVGESWSRIPGKNDDAIDRLLQDESVRAFLKLRPSDFVSVTEGGVTVTAKVVGGIASGIAEVGGVAFTYRVTVGEWSFLYKRVGSSGASMDANDLRETEDLDTSATDLNNNVQKGIKKLDSAELDAPDAPDTPLDGAPVAEKLDSAELDAPDAPLDGAPVAKKPRVICKRDTGCVTSETEEGAGDSFADLFIDGLEGGAASDGLADTALPAGAFFAGTMLTVVGLGAAGSGNQNEQPQSPPANSPSDSHSHSPVTRKPKSGDNSNNQGGADRPAIDQATTDQTPLTTSKPLAEPSTTITTPEQTKKSTEKITQSNESLTTRPDISPTTEETEKTTALEDVKQTTPLASAVSQTTESTQTETTPDEKGVSDSVGTTQQVSSMLQTTPQPSGTQSTSGVTVPDLTTSDAAGSTIQTATTVSPESELEALASGVLDQSWLDNLLEHFDLPPEARKMFGIINKFSVLLSLLQQVTLFADEIAEDYPEEAESYRSLAAFIKQEINGLLQPAHSRTRRSDTDDERDKRIQENQESLNKELDKSIRNILDKLAKKPHITSYKQLFRGYNARQKSVLSADIDNTNMEELSDEDEIIKRAMENDPHLSEYNTLKNNFRKLFNRGSYFEAGKKLFDAGYIKLLMDGGTISENAARLSGFKEQFLEKIQSHPDFTAFSAFKFGSTLHYALLLSNPFFMEEKGVCFSYLLLESLAADKSLLLTKVLENLKNPQTPSETSILRTIFILQNFLDVGFHMHPSTISKVRAASEKVQIESASTRLRLKEVLQELGLKIDSQLFESLFKQVTALRKSITDVKGDTVRIDNIATNVIERFKILKAEAEKEGKEFNSVQIRLNANEFIEKPHVIRISLTEHNNGQLYKLQYENSATILLDFSASSLENLDSDSVKQKFNKVVEEDLKAAYNYHGDVVSLSRITPAQITNLGILKLNPGSPLTLNEIVNTPESGMQALIEEKELALFSDFFNKLAEPGVSQALSLSGTVIGKDSPRMVSSSESMVHIVRELVESIGTNQAMGKAIPVQTRKLTGDVVQFFTKTLKLINNMPDTTLALWLTQKQLNGLRSLSQAMLNACIRGGIPADDLPEFRTQVDVFSQKTEHLTVVEVQLPDAPSHALPSATKSKFKKSLKSQAEKIALKETPVKADGTKTPNKEALLTAEKQVVTQFLDGVKVFSALTGMGKSKSKIVETNAANDLLAETVDAVAEQSIEQVFGEKEPAPQIKQKPIDSIDELMEDPQVQVFLNIKASELVSVTEGGITVTGAVVGGVASGTVLIGGAAFSYRSAQASNLAYRPLGSTGEYTSEIPTKEPVDPEEVEQLIKKVLEKVEGPPKTDTVEAEVEDVPVEAPVKDVPEHMPCKRDLRGCTPFEDAEEGVGDTLGDLLLDGAAGEGLVDAAPAIGGGFAGSLLFLFGLGAAASNHDSERTQTSDEPPALPPVRHEHNQPSEHEANNPVMPVATLPPATKEKTLTTESPATQKVPEGVTQGGALTQEPPTTAAPGREDTTPVASSTQELPTTAAPGREDTTPVASSTQELPTTAAPGRQDTTPVALSTQEPPTTAAPGRQDTTPVALSTQEPPTTAASGREDTTPVASSTQEPPTTAVTDREGTTPVALSTQEPPTTAASGREDTTPVVLSTQEPPTTAAPDREDTTPVVLSTQESPKTTASGREDTTQESLATTSKKSGSISSEPPVAQPSLKPSRDLACKVLVKFDFPEWFARGVFTDEQVNHMYGNMMGFLESSLGSISEYLSSLPKATTLPVREARDLVRMFLTDDAALVVRTRLLSDEKFKPCVSREGEASYENDMAQKREIIDLVRLTWVKDKWFKEFASRRQGRVTRSIRHEHHSHRSRQKQHLMREIDKKLFEVLQGEKDSQKNTEPAIRGRRKRAANRHSDELSEIARVQGELRMVKNQLQSFEGVQLPEKNVRVRKNRKLNCRILSRYKPSSNSKSVASESSDSRVLEAAYNSLPSRLSAVQSMLTALLKHSRAGKINGLVPLLKMLKKMKALSNEREKFLRDGKFYQPCTDKKGRPIAATSPKQTKLLIKHMRQFDVTVKQFEKANQHLLSTYRIPSVTLHTRRSSPLGLSREAEIRVLHSIQTELEKSRRLVKQLKVATVQEVIQHPAIRPVASLGTNTTAPADNVARHHHRRDTDAVPKPPAHHNRKLLSVGSEHLEGHRPLDGLFREDNDSQKPVSSSASRLESPINKGFQILSTFAKEILNPDISAFFSQFTSYFNGPVTEESSEKPNSGFEAHASKENSTKELLKETGVKEASTRQWRSTVTVLGKCEGESNDCKAQVGVMTTHSDDPAFCYSQTPEGDKECSSFQFSAALGTCEETEALNMENLFSKRKFSGNENSSRDDSQCNEQEILAAAAGSIKEMMKEQALSKWQKSADYLNGAHGLHMPFTHKPTFLETLDLFESSHGSLPEGFRRDAQGNILLTVTGESAFQFDLTNNQMKGELSEAESGVVTPERIDLIRRAATMDSRMAAYLQWQPIIETPRNLAEILNLLACTINDRSMIKGHWSDVQKAKETGSHTSLIGVLQDGTDIASDLYDDVKNYIKLAKDGHCDMSHWSNSDLTCISILQTYLGKTKELRSDVLAKQFISELLNSPVGPESQSYSDLFDVEENGGVRIRGRHAEDNIKGMSGHSFFKLATVYRQMNDDHPVERIQLCSPQNGNRLELVRCMLNVMARSCLDNSGSKYIDVARQLLKEKRRINESNTEHVSISQCLQLVDDWCTEAKNSEPDLKTRYVTDLITLINKKLKSFDMNSQDRIPLSIAIWERLHQIQSLSPDEAEDHSLLKDKAGQLAELYHQSYSNAVSSMPETMSSHDIDVVKELHRDIALTCFHQLVDDVDSNELAHKISSMVSKEWQVVAKEHEEVSHETGVGFVRVSNITSPREKDLINSLNIFPEQSNVYLPAACMPISLSAASTSTQPATMS